MRIIEDVPLSLVVVDHYKLAPETLALVAYLEDGGTVPPIHTARLPGGRHKLLDGRHRVTAAKLLGRTSIRARFSRTYLQQREGGPCVTD